jgi:hypothetical protein
MPRPSHQPPLLLRTHFGFTRRQLLAACFSHTHCSLLSCFACNDLHTNLPSWYAHILLCSCFACQVLHTNLPLRSMFFKLLLLPMTCDCHMLFGTATSRPRFALLAHIFDRNHNYIHYSLLSCFACHAHHTNLPSCFAHILDLHAASSLLLASTTYTARFSVASHATIFTPTSPLGTHTFFFAVASLAKFFTRTSLFVPCSSSFCSSQ